MRNKANSPGGAGVTCTNKAKLGRGGASGGPVRQGLWEEACCTNKPNSWHYADPEIGGPGRAIVQNKPNCPPEKSGEDAQPTKSRLCETKPIRRAARRLGVNCTNKANSHHGVKTDKGLSRKELW